MGEVIEMKRRGYRECSSRARLAGLEGATEWEGIGSIAQRVVDELIVSQR